jgi:long-subunit fatty acid transport protein
VSARTFLLHCCAVAALSLATVSIARADSPTEALLKDRFNYEAGTFLVSPTMNASLSGTANTAHQSIDFDKEFGTDASETRLRAEFMWRITQRQHLRLVYFGTSVGKTRPIDRNLEWGDYTFVAGGEVTAETKMQVYELDYEFAFLRRENYEVLFTAGIHFDRLKTKLSGNASLTVDTPGGPVEQAATFESKQTSVPIPLPVLGLRGAWALSDHVYLDAVGKVFKLSYEGIDGNWTEFRAGVAWMFNEHFGIGLGYDRFMTHVNLSKESFNGRLNLGYQGALIYLTGGF